MRVTRPSHRATPTTSLFSAAGQAEAGRVRPVLAESLESRTLMSGDLTVSDLSISESASSAGAEIHTQFTYTNLGDAFEAAWNIELRLSSDETWGNADDIVLGIEREDEDLEHGQSSLETESVIIPSGAAAGTYRLAVFIDSDNEVAESDEGNNVAFGVGTIEVGSGGGGGGGGVDLTASDASGTLDVGGDEITVTYTYTNAGSAFNGFFDQEFRLSLNQVWGDSDDVVLGVAREVEDLAPGESSVESESWALPAGMAAGAYYVGVFVDSTGVVAESSESNNTAWSAATVSIAGGGGGGGGGSGLNLTASDVSGVVQGDDEINVSYTYTNAGTAFNGFFDQEFRLSLNQVWGDADDIVLGVAREVEDLSPGQSSIEDESWALPAGIEPGDYYVAVFVDSTAAVAETSEADNIAWSSTTIGVSGGGGGGGGVDLTLRQVIASPEPRPAGEDANIAWTIVNAGGAFNGAFNQQVRLSLDTVWGNGDDIILGVEREDEDFRAGQSSVEDESFDIPLGTPDGVYYVAINIDSSSEVTETDEANNIVFSAEPAVTVGSGGPTSSRGYGVFGLGRCIDDDDVAPRRDDSTAFNRLRVDGRIREASFTIHNFGLDDMEIERYEIRGRNTRDFAIAVAPDASLAPGASTTIVVRFDPTRAGVRFARLVLDTSRDTNDDYQFKLKGIGLIPADATDASVLGRGQEIRDDDLSPGGGDGTRFRTLTVGDTQDRTFTIQNQGATTLLFTTPLIRLTGAGAGAFSITTLPAASIAPGASTTFTVRFSPGAAQKYAANIEILSNDPDESIYNFRIVGRGE